jgi:hypothetical protein
VLGFLNKPTDYVEIGCVVIGFGVLQLYEFIKLQDRRTWL